MTLRLALALALLGPPAGAGDYFTLSGHGGPIMGVAVSDDDTIATASFDNAVGLWTGRTPSWRDGHEAAVNVVAFDPQGTVWSGADDFALIEWSTPPERHTGHRGKVMSIAFGPDGLVATASWDGTVGLWTDGQAPRFLTGHTSAVNHVAFDRDGTLYSASADGTIRVWDTATGTETRRLTEHGFGINELTVGDGWLAYGAVDGGTIVLDLPEGDRIADLSAGRRPVLAMAHAPGSQKLAVGDGEGFIMVVDTATWRITQDFRATTRGPIWALAFSKDGTNIHAGGLDDTLHSWPLDALEGPMASDGKAFLADPETLPNGERQFKRKCSICHTLTPGTARRAGPSLHALFGRPAGTVSDYTYSDALTGLDLIWTADSIDALFDIGPEAYIPGTKMPAQRIARAQDRADLIDYLRRETRPED